MLALVSHHENPTHVRLAAAAPPGVEVKLVPPGDALSLLGPDDAALARLDVLPTLDGIEPGVWEIGRLEAERHPGSEQRCARSWRRTTSSRPHACCWRPACRIRAPCIS